MAILKQPRKIPEKMGRPSYWKEMKENMSRMMKSGRMTFLLILPSLHPSSIILLLYRACALPFSHLNFLTKPLSSSSASKVVKRRDIEL
jgi:hypothetical protein